MRAILLIDHGSKVDAANHMLKEVADLLRSLTDSYLVEIAHMELAEPSIAQGFDACISAGAKEVIAVPYMLSPGRHSTKDIPKMVKEAAKNHPQVSFRVTDCLGVNPKICEVILERVKLSHQSIKVN